jgi:YidC/Oxa1 family membrane protein insertase
VWDTLIQGFVVALIWLYKVLGSSEWSLVFSITALTAAIRVITIPLTLPSQQAMKRNSAKMQALQPELDKLKKKYRNEPQKLQEAQLRLYKEHGINPVSSLTGCLPLLIQLPIIWAFYQSISQALANQPGQMLALHKHLSAMPQLITLIPLPSKWLWFDLARPDLIALPILVAGSTWLQQKLASWFKSNDKLMKGSMTLKGNPFVRVGKFLQYLAEEEPFERRTFYIEAYSQNYNYGGNFQTSVTLTRGIPHKLLDPRGLGRDVPANRVASPIFVSQSDLEQAAFEMEVQAASSERQTEQNAKAEPVD